MMGTRGERIRAEPERPVLAKSEGGYVEDQAAGWSSSNGSASPQAHCADGGSSPDASAVEGGEAASSF